MSKHVRYNKRKQRWETVRGKRKRSVRREADTNQMTVQPAPELPDGYLLVDVFRFDEPDHLPGTVSVVQMHELQTGDAQRYNGSCVVLSALPGATLRVNYNNTATFLMYDLLGNPQEVTVPTLNKITDAVGVLGWAEKAYAIWLRRNGLVDPNKSAWQEMDDGNYMYQGLMAFTGKKAHDVQGTLETTTSWIDEQLDRGATVLVGAIKPTVDLITQHAYRVIDAEPEWLMLQNPYGKDGRRPTGNPNDGIIVIEAADWLSQVTSTWIGVTT